MDDPFKTFDEIRSAFLRYLDSPFRLRYEALMEERRELVDQDHQLYRHPLIEPIPPYESSGLSIYEACEHLGVSPDAGELISRGLFLSNRTLYRHQLDAWRESRDGQAVIVTSATNSGKTECYLIPVFAYLAEQSATSWGVSGPPTPPWSNPEGRDGRHHGHESQPNAPLRCGRFPVPP